MDSHQRRVLAAIVVRFVFSAVLVAGYRAASAADALPQSADLGLPFQVAPQQSVNLLGTIIAEVIKYIGVFAIIVTAWGGVQFVISDGDDKKMKEARSTITYALIGVAISISAYLMVTIVNNLQI